MMKKILVISTIVLTVITAGLSIWYFFLKKKNRPLQDIFVAIPTDAQWIIEIRDPFKKFGKLNNSSAATALEHLPAFRQAAADISLLDSLTRSMEAFDGLLQESPLIIAAFWLPQKHEFSFLYACQFHHTISPTLVDRFVTGINPSASMESISVGNYKARRVSITSQKESFYYYAGKSVFLGSKSLETLEKSLAALNSENLSSDKTFTALYKNANTSSDFQLYIHWNSLAPQLPAISGNSAASRLLSLFSGWSALSGLIETDGILLKGLTMPADTSVFAGLLKQGEISRPEVLDFIPANASSVVLLGTIPEIFSPAKANPLAESFLDEAVLIHVPSSNEEGENFLVIPVNMDRFEERLPSETPRSEYKNYPVMAFEASSDLMQFPMHHFEKTDSLFFTTESGNLIIAGSRAALYSWVDHYLAKYTMGFNKTISKELDALENAAFSIILDGAFTDASTLETAFPERSPFLTEGADTLLQFINPMVLSIRPKGTFFETRISIRFGGKPGDLKVLSRGEVPEGMISGPFPLLGKNGHALGYAFFDSAAKMVFVDSSGATRWKRVFDGHPAQQPYSLLLTENKIPAFVFSTQGFIYAVDMEGKDLPNYPMLIPGEALNPLTVIRYDAQSDYRFFFAYTDGKKNNIALWDQTGAPVAGWDFKTTTLPVTEPVKYLRINQKDYLLFIESDGTVHLLDRPGKTHLLLNKKISSVRTGPIIPMIKTGIIDSYLAYSTSDGTMDMIFLDKGKDPISKELPTEGTLEAILDIDMDKSNDLILNAAGAIKAVDYQSGNTKFIFNTGNPSGVKVHPVLKNNKFYMLIFDQQSSKLYGINQEGNILNGFPVNGCRDMLLADINGDGTEELLLLTSTHEFLVIETKF